MFNRLKGFNLDNFLEGKLAEDEAKKAQQQQAQQSRPSTKRTPSTARRGSARGNTPSGRREGSRLRVPDGESPLPTKGPDPEEFVIGDDASDVSGISRAATPKPVKEGEEGPAQEGKEDAGQDASAQPASPEKQDGAAVGNKGKEKAAALTDEELPMDVRRRLAKLDTLTTKYQGMLTDKPLHRDWHLLFYSQHMLCTDLLKNYRMAHSRVAAIEPFEATLREHTSLTSIADPGALVEFLEARNLQKDMVMEELRRISGEHDGVKKERDELKVKLEDAEKRAKEAFDEAAGLRKERETGMETETPTPAAGDKPEQATESRGPPTEDETFFDYDSELPRLQEELQEQKEKVEEQTAYINELSTENATVKQSLDASQLDLDAMYNKVDVKEREIAGLKGELKEAAEAKKAAEDQESEASASLAQTEGQIFDLQTRLKTYQEDMEKEKKELHDKLEASEKRYSLEHDDGQQEKRKQFQEKILNSMRDQLKEAQEAKAMSEGKYRDLELEFNRISSECDNKGEIITNLRGQEDANKSLRERNSALERERDDTLRMMDSKKGHESAVASLRSQLKQAQRDRDDAYKIILKCGQCEAPIQNGEAVIEGATQASTPASRSRHGSEATEQTEASTQPTEVSTPPVEPEAPAAGEGAKKKKNKNKKKKAQTKKDTVESTEPAKTEEPAKMPQSKNMANQHLKFVMDKIQADDDENERLLRHHEGKLEEQEQTIQGHLQTIRQKDEEIVGLNEKLRAEEAEVAKVSGKLKEQEGLEEELESLRDELTDLGKQNTDFKHERKTASDSQATMQKELDEALAEGDRLRKGLKEAEKQRGELDERFQRLEQEFESKSDEAAAAIVKERDIAREDAKKASQLKFACEKQIEDLQAQIKANEGETADLLKVRTESLDRVKAEKSGLEKDLAAANSLAQTRYKDLTELREHSNKLQAELKKVKDEASELRSAKTDLEKSNASLKKLESKEKDLRSEIAEYKKQIGEKDSELSGLKDRVKKSDERNTALEDTCERARKDLEDNEKTRDDAVDARDKAQAGLKKVEGELKSAKGTLEDLQRQVAKFRDEATGLRKEIESKSALLSSSQSLADGYQDQQREMAAQVKEHMDRAEGLEEELADVHRLLSERGREGETMRRLIEDVKNERDRKVREMQAERDRAVEERDRADDEASSIGRRKAREIQDLKAKLSDAEQAATHAGEARADAEKREREARSLREDLERRAAKAEEDLAQRRDALAQIQATLDESQRLYGVLEREKGELARALEERQGRLEKVQRASKGLAEEVAALKKARVGGSARTSVDSSSRVTSPAPPAPPSRGGGAGTPQGGGGVVGDDMVNRAVIRSTLLNFMQQKDKRVQMSMVGPGGPLAKMLGFGP